MSNNSIGKVESFNIMSKKQLSKKELEKQKKQQEEQAAAEVYQEFVETFEKPSSIAKMFVLGSVINSGHEEERESFKVYKPTKLQELEEKKKRDELFGNQSGSSSKSMAKLPKKKEKEKKKSNLELFKEELKLIQEEREERHRLKTMMKEKGIKEPDSNVKSGDEYRPPTYGSFDTGDPNTTNIYLGNINPKMTEQQLMEVFGKYGPLASVKIMWPRSDEERARNRNCGFVAFMNRKDGERALKAISGKEVMGYEMKLGWGKAVPIPPHPIYIPTKLRELTMPPPPSGLPFNAQPDPKDMENPLPTGTPYSMMSPQDKENFNRIVNNATVKVVMPTDRTLLCLIHRMVEFVVKEGPMFEAMIMNREINNPIFRFLFDNQSPAHIYYRWRLFSVLQGEHPSKWRTQKFRLFEGGSLWKPPPLNPWLQGMPEHLIETSPEPEDKIEGPKKTSKSKSKEKDQYSRGFKESKEKDLKKEILSDAQREKLEDILRNLTPDRSKICDAMIYCIDHAEAAEEIVDCITESLSILETPLHKKIARLYLISDILHNCSVKVSNASYYRKGFQSRLISIFTDIHECYNNIEGRLKAEQFKHRVMSCFKAWEDWAIYTSDFLIKLQNIFLGLFQGSMVGRKTSNDDIDGVPVEESDIDGIPIGNTDVSESNISLALKFKPSKWETVDPDIVEAQAMTTSKWEMLEQTKDNEDDEDIDGVPIHSSSPYLISGDDNRSSLFLEQLKTELSGSEGRRVKLREIELKVLKFQDELESGAKSRKHGQSLFEQVSDYRKKLMRKLENENGHDNSRKKSRSRSKSPKVYTSPYSSHYSSKKRSKTRSRSKSRTRSPYERKRSSSRDSSSYHRSRSPGSRKHDKTKRR